MTWNISPDPEALIALTPEWKGDRFDDGRPRVPEKTLQALRTATSEQIWDVLWPAEYPHQFEGGWKQTNPGKITVGRAVTGQFYPFRKDFDAAVVEAGRRVGFTVGDRQNTWLIESLQEDDCMVVDMYGKISGGTVIGDNLGTAVAKRTGVGCVINGGVRDLPGLQELSEANMFFRDAHPVPILDYCLVGINIPVMVGPSTVLPGDVVHGGDTGVTFIPPQLAEECAQVARETAHRDVFGKQRIATMTYTTTEIDVKTWADHIEADYVEWTKENPLDD